MFCIVYSIVNLRTCLRLTHSVDMCGHTSSSLEQFKPGNRTSEKKVHGFGFRWTKSLKLGDHGDFVVQQRAFPCLATIQGGTVVEVIRYSSTFMLSIGQTSASFFSVRFGAGRRQRGC